MLCIGRGFKVWGHLYLCLSIQCICSHAVQYVRCQLWSHVYDCVCVQFSHAVHVTRSNTITFIFIIVYVYSGVMLCMWRGQIRVHSSLLLSMCTVEPCCACDEVKYEYIHLYYCLCVQWSHVVYVMRSNTSTFICIIVYVYSGAMLCMWWGQIRGHLWGTLVKTHASKGRGLCIFDLMPNLNNIFNILCFYCQTIYWN